MSKLISEVSPHFFTKRTTRRIMLDVIIALIPAGIASVFLFGPRTLLVIGVCVCTCVLSEYLFERVCKKESTIGDLSAVVTGLLLAYNLPVSIPLWQALIGSVVAIVVTKQLFGNAVRADEVTGLMMEKAEEIGGETFIQVHPTFLYESLWNLGVLMLLLLMTKNKFKKADGEIFLWYLLLYGIGRFWIEGLRTDQLLVWGTDIAVSQLLAAVLAVGSGLLILLIRFVFTGAGRGRKS